MHTDHSLNTPRPTRGFRTGIVLGLVIAALGIAVGTVAGATSKDGVTTADQDVFVVNNPKYPIPVTGRVTVNNLPATQRVSGTVMVANVANRAWGNFDFVDPNGGLRVFPIPHGINATSISVTNIGLLPIRFEVNLLLTSGPAPLRDPSCACPGGQARVYAGVDNFSRDFTVPVALDSVSVSCLSALPCKLLVSVIGY